MNSLTSKSRGFTLIELLVAIAVVAILLTLAVPSIQQTIKNNRVSSQGNELVALISLAKSEAIRRNREVTLQLNEGAAAWNGQVLDPGGEEEVEGCALGVLRCADHERVGLDAPAEITFDNRGYLTDFSEKSATLTHEECSGLRQRIRIEILPTGQVTSCATGCEAESCNGES